MFVPRAGQADHCVRQRDRVLFLEGSPGPGGWFLKLEHGAGSVAEEPVLAAEIRPGSLDGFCVFLAIMRFEFFSLLALRPVWGYIMNVRDAPA